MRLRSNNAELRLHGILTIGFIVSAGFLPSCVTPPTTQNKPPLPATQLRDDVFVRELAKGIWLDTTYYNMPDLGRYPANGLIVIDGADAVMINLPWTESQTALLFDWVTKEQHAKIKTVVPTHWHLDCSGGLAEAHRRGADSLALDMTSELLKKAGRPEPHRAFSGRTSLFSGRARIELAHLGPGHTADNIVAWIPSARILFGGCLVKAQRATDLGNIVDADVKEYPNTLQKLKKAYSRAITVVPGHWEPGGLELIDHSIELCEKAPH